MTPRLHACYFRSGAEDTFPRMARVLACTAAWHCAEWQRSIQSITPAERLSAIGKRQHVANVQKIEHWASVILAAADGDQVALLDVDTAIVRPLDDIWDRPFDLAYTTKRRPYPFNLGVLFLRVSDRTRAFMTAWRDENLQLLADRTGTDAWRQQFGGINQASFGRLIARGVLSDLALETLPCREWNCEESGWPTFDPAVTRILHVKGALRGAMFKREAPPQELRTALMWYQAREGQVSRQADQSQLQETA